MMRDKNQVKLPIELGIKIGEEDPVRKLVEICEQLDFTKLFQEYIRKWKKVNPITLFEVVLYGYMNRKYSSREIEEACRTDIRFMWILQDEPVPDHSTIARFQNERLGTVIEELFYQVIEKLMEMGEVSYKNVFVDGTKIEANANRYSFVWAKAIEKQLKKLDSRIEAELPPIAMRYGMNESVGIEECVEYMLNIARLTEVKFVNGQGKRKTQLQRDIEKLVDFMERKQKYLECTGKFKGRKSYSKTDIDATFMRMKEDHMHNGQLKPGYNAQIAVEGEYIVGIGLFPKPTDVTTLIPFLDRIYGRTRRRIERLIADAGYESEENYTYLEEHGQKAYIKPNNYEQSKTRKYKNNIYRIENLHYDEAADVFICPNGKKLKFICEGRKKTENDYITVQQHYRCEDCSGCPHREICYKGTYENREIAVSRNFMRQRSQSLKNITTEEGILLCINRSIQVEGAFGVIKQDYGFRRFLTRGKRKTETQFFLLGIAFNIQKLCNRQKSGRFGKSLFEKMIA